MQEVKRWTTYGMGCDMMDDEDGEFVLYTDAVKMQREAFVNGGWWGEKYGTGPMGVAIETEVARRYKEE